MSRSRLYLSIVRIFRLRNRRPAKENANSGLPRPSSHLALLSQPEPADAGPIPSAVQSRTVSTHSPGEPIAYRSPPAPVLVIGQGTTPSITTPPTPIPALSGHAEQQQVALDGVLPLETPPVRTGPDTAPVPSHVPSAHAVDLSDHLPSPSSTLGPIEEENVAGYTAPLVVNAPTPGAGGGAISALSDNGIRGASGRGRAATFYSPQVAHPTRPQKRFSLPSTLSGYKTARRGSSASTLTPSSPTFSQKEKRASRISKELNKPEMQMTLSILRSL